MNKNFKTTKCPWCNKTHELIGIRNVCCDCSAKLYRTHGFWLHRNTGEKRWEFFKGQKLCISVKSLSRSFGSLTYGRIVSESSEGELIYCDLYNADGEHACCDGEVCTIIGIGSELITFSNDNGESTVCFALTREETEVAVFK